MQKSCNSISNALDDGLIQKRGYSIAGGLDDGLMQKRSNSIANTPDYSLMQKRHNSIADALDNSLMQKRHNSIANTMELCLFCIKLSTYISYLPRHQASLPIGSYRPLHKPCWGLPYQVGCRYGYLVPSFTDRRWSLIGT